MNNKIETRAFNISIRSESVGNQNISSKKRTIIGRPIVFNSRTNLGTYDEIIESTALKNTNLDDVRFLVNHNTDMIPLARFRRNSLNNTMALTKDSYGLSIKAILDTENNNDAKALCSSIERGDVSSMSFMFIVDKDRWDNTDSNHPTRHILSIKQVFEVSAVTFPAYQDTSIQAKSSTQSDAEKKALEIAKAKAILKIKLENGKSYEDMLELEKAKAKAKLQLKLNR